jgi:hypothetical protein
VSSIWHLVRRFGGSLSPLPPPPAEEAWARSWLLPAEVALWRRLGNPDRRHAIGVARRVGDRLGEAATPAVMAAALLHDSGKVSAGLGTFGRVGATVAAGVLGRRSAARWSHGRLGVTRRVGLYLRHPELGAELLTRAGSDPLTVAWTGQHHQPPDRWTVPRPLADALKNADDD